MQAWLPLAPHTTQIVSKNKLETANVNHNPADKPLKSTANCPPVMQSNAANKVEKRLVSNPNKLQDLLAQILIKPEREAPPPFSQAVDLLKEDSLARANLIAQYQQETDPYARSQIRALLSFIATPDVIDLGIQMSSDEEPSLRKEGYEMLQTIQISSREARETLINALNTELNPNALRAAITSLVPGNSEPLQDTTRVLEQLNRISEHASPTVRAESLLAVTRWNHGAGNEAVIYNGLKDPQTSVREAAMTAMFENPTQSARLKSALLDVAVVNTNEPKTREMAVEALGGFNLSEQEKTLLSEVRNRIPTWQ